MGILARWIERLDSNLASNIDRHLELAIPTQRKSTSPLSVMPTRDEVERLGIWPCCPCCSAYEPQPCPVVHRTPCDKPACDQDGGAA